MIIILLHKLIFMAKIMSLLFLIIKINDEYYQKVNLIHENEQKEFGTMLDGLLLLGYHNNNKLYLILNNLLCLWIKLELKEWHR